MLRALIPRVNQKMATTSIDGRHFILFLLLGWALHLTPHLFRSETDSKLIPNHMVSLWLVSLVSTKKRNASRTFNRV